MGLPHLDKKLRRAASKGRLEEIEALLNAGADIEGRGGFFSLSQTPLACAAWAGNTEAVLLLIRKGADVEAPDMSGDTALWVAISNGHKDVVQVLLEHGANPHARVAARQTPLELARQKKDDAMIAMVRKAMREWDEKERLAREKAEQDRIAREKAAREAERCKNKDVVIFFRELGDRTIEEIYNFPTLERVTFVRKGEEGPVEAVTRQNFSDIGEKSVLRKAFEEHVRRGGTTSVHSVFPDEWRKIPSRPRNEP